MKKIFKVLFVVAFLPYCLPGYIDATPVAFSYEVVSYAMIRNIGEAEQRGINNAKLDCRNKSINRSSIRSRNPYSPGSREYSAYQEAYNRTYNNCKKAR